MTGLNEFSKNVIWADAFTGISFVSLPIMSPLKDLLKLFWHFQKKVPKGFACFASK